MKPTLTLLTALLLAPLAAVHAVADSADWQAFLMLALSLVEGDCTLS